MIPAQQQQEPLQQQQQRMRQKLEEKQRQSSLSQASEWDSDLEDLVNPVITPSTQTATLNQTPTPTTMASSTITKEVSMGWFSTIISNFE